MKTNAFGKTRNSNEVFLSKTSATKKTLINIQYLQEISGGNASFINAILYAFRDESAVFLRQMERLIASQDFLSIKQIAHKMKPSGAYIGADSLTALVSNLEQAAEKTNSKEARSIYNGIKSLLKNILDEIDGFLNEPSLI